MVLPISAVPPPYGWQLDPGPLLLMGPLTIAYVYRWRKVRERWWKLALFLSGMFVALMAFWSPVDSLGRQLFVMHMTQHLMLLDIAPVLCILGLSKKIFRPATKALLPLERQSPWLFSPVIGVAAYVGGMWLWHTPAMYDAAVRHSQVHVMEHITFAIVGGMYWWHLISPVRDKRRLSGMTAVMYMAGTKLAVGLLGILISFAPQVLYSVYAQGPNIWGLPAHEDQQLGGLLMATEQSVIMGVALAWLVIAAIDKSEKDQLRLERYGPGGSELTAEADDEAPAEPVADQRPAREPRPATGPAIAAPPSNGALHPPPSVSSGALPPGVVSRPRRGPA